MSSLTSFQILEDLSRFQTLLETRFAYRWNGEPDVGAAIDGLREKSATYRTQGALGFEVQKVLALFIDGHAQVSRIGLANGYLPFLLEAVGERVVAILPDRRGFVEDAYPYLEKLDGLDLSEWLALSACVVARGSPQYRRLRSIRLLGNLQHWRAVAGHPQKVSVTLELASLDGKSRVSRVVSLTDTAPRYGVWPARPSQRLPGGITYLRLGSMQGSLEAETQWAFADLERARGLIIDLRGNSGGTRQALVQLAPRLFSEEALPSVASVAAYRLHPEVSEDHLAARVMYRGRDVHYAESEKRIIRAFRASFKPAFELPKGKFSDWHYLVVSKGKHFPTRSERPQIVVLQDVHCFSATDIFLAAFKGKPGVTLVGEASSGGSGYPLVYELKHSGLKLRLSSMLSYQPSGELYDTNGVRPDVALEPRPTDFLVAGGADTTLEWVLENCFSG